MSKNILFRGQTRKKGEKVTMSGTPIPSNWVFGGIFPQNNGGDFAIIYQQDPEIQKFPVYAETVCQYTGKNDKYGGKIFENDIITYVANINASDVPCKGNVFYSEALAAYMVTVKAKAKGECDMFIVIKSEHYDCTNLICKKDTLEEAAAAVRESIAQRINKNYHTGLTGADITHENEERYRFSFDFDENCPADNSEPRVHATYDFWKGDDEESVEWAVFEVTTDKPFFLLSYEEYESIELTGFYDSFDEAFEEMKELIAESVNDVFDEDATADDVEDMEDYNVFVHSNKDSKDSGAPLAFASFCDDYPNREWTIFHI